MGLCSFFFMCEIENKLFDAVKIPFQKAYSFDHKADKGDNLFENVNTVFKKQYGQWTCISWSELKSLAA